MNIAKNEAGVNTPGYNSRPPAATTRCIEVLSIEPGTSPGVLAIVTVRIGDNVIRQVRVPNRGRRTVVDFPSRKMKSELVTLTALDLHGKVVNVVLGALWVMDGEQ